MRDHAGRGGTGERQAGGQDGRADGHRPDNGAATNGTLTHCKLSGAGSPGRDDRVRGPAMSQPKTLREVAGLPSGAPALRGSVLIMIDLQNTYRSGVMRLEGVEPAIAEAATLLGRARDAGIPIFHVQHDAGAGSPYDLNDRSGAIAEEVKRDDAFRDTLLRNPEQQNLQRDNAPSSIQIPRLQMNGWSQDPTASQSATTPRRYLTSVAYTSTCCTRALSFVSLLFYRLPRPLTATSRRPTVHQPCETQPPAPQLS